ncbi:TonB-dependent receptor [uncultured Halovibrio sp.]|uniref:TonB-dependent receptor n=1 Tax=uncultured Halovibrio sp. TaxID=985049 RepID=UPI0025D6F6F8|nr:TonB-dependent receptor [uncultured Halovibrio sp.]
MNVRQGPSLLSISIALLSTVPGAVIAQEGTASQRTFSAPTLEVQASADASEEGLSPAFAGGQVAEGGRVGLLGNQDVMETPYNFTNYTELLIEDQQAASVGDVLLNDPAVRVARGFGNFQQVYLVRGLPVFSDDMTYNGLYGLLPRQYLASEFIQRVQVFRGANTFLKGAAPGGSGLGGAVNVVPKRAPNHPLTQVTTGVQSGGQAYAAADVARRSEDGRYGVRVNAARRDGDTAVDGESRELSMTHIGLDYQGDDLRLSADLGYQDHLMDASQPNITIKDGLAIPDAPDASESIGQPWTYSESEDVFGTVRGEYDFNEAINGWLAFGLRQGEEEASFANPKVDNPNGDYKANLFDNTREDTVKTGEMGLRTNFKTGSIGHEVTLVGSVHDFESKNAYAGVQDGVSSNIYAPTSEPKPAYNYSGGELGNPGLTIKKHLESIALADQLSLMDERLLITLGARHQRIENYSYDYNTGAENTEYDDSFITPTLGVLYKLSQTISTYANYIEGVDTENAPSFVGNQAVANPGEALEPYTTNQSELGIKYESNSLGGNVSIYRSEKPTAGLDNNSIYRVLYDQSNTGLELSGYGKATQNLTLLGGVSFLDADADGNEAIGSPDTQANLNLKYDVPALPDLALDSRLIYTSSQYADSNNQQKVPSWTRLDIGARYLVPMGDDRLLTVRARVENVADHDYWASAGGYPGQGYLTVGAPRTFMLSATVDF